MGETIRVRRCCYRTVSRVLSSAGRTITGTLGSTARPPPSVRLPDDLPGPPVEAGANGAPRYAVLVSLISAGSCDDPRYRLGDAGMRNPERSFSEACLETRVSVVERGFCAGRPLRHVSASPSPHCRGRLGKVGRDLIHAVPQGAAQSSPTASSCAGGRSCAPRGPDRVSGEVYSSAL